MFAITKTKNMALTRSGQIVLTPTTGAPRTSSGIQQQLPSVNQQANQQQFAQVFASAMASAMAGMNNVTNQYTTDLSSGSVTTTYPIPKTINWSATSAAGSGARAVEMFIFNEDQYNASPTTNGSAANSVTTTYGDGFNGKQYNQLLKFPGDTVGKGIKIYGWNIIYTVASSGVQDPNGLLNADFTWNTLNGYGKFIPETIDLSPGVNPGNFQDGLLRIEYPMYLNDISQFSINLPAGDTVSLSFFTVPMQ